MRSTAKPCRAQCELTDEEDEAFTVAISRRQESLDARITRQSELRKMIAAYCKDAGVRFPSPSRSRSRPPRSQSRSAAAAPTQTPPQ